MSQPTPASRYETLVDTRPADPPVQPQPVREWHTFEEVSYIVLTTHRGFVLRRESAWISSGRMDAIRDATSRGGLYRIPEAPTDLTVWVFERHRRFDRLYVGTGPNPSYYRGSDAPEQVPLYDGYGRNYRVTELRVVHCSNPNLAVAGDPVPPDMAENPYLTGD